MMTGVMFVQLSTSTTAYMGGGSPARQIPVRQQQKQQWGLCGVYEGDENSVSSEDNNNIDDVMLLPVLEADLARLKASSSSATTQDEEGGAAVIQDVIKELEEKIDNAKTAAEFGIRKTQSEFYDAFSNHNLQQMTEVWSRCDDVSCVHPMGGKLQGNEAVMQSWKNTFSGVQRSEEDDDETEENFRIVPSRVDITICGRTG